MKKDRPLIVPKELMSLDAGTKKNIDLFNDMLKQTEQLIKERLKEQLQQGAD